MYLPCLVLKKGRKWEKNFPAFHHHCINLSLSLSLMCRLWKDKLIHEKMFDATQGNMRDLQDTRASMQTC